MLRDDFNSDDCWSFDRLHGSHLRHRYSSQFVYDDDLECEEEESSDENPLSYSQHSDNSLGELDPLPRLVLESNLLHSKQMVNMNHESFVKVFITSNNTTFRHIHTFWLIYKTN